MLIIMILVILFSLLSPSSLSCLEPLNISFPSFDSTNCNNGAELICMGTVMVENRSMRLTEHDPKAPKNQVGRFLYALPMLAWPASFCTIFTIKIVSNSSDAGDGMAFILAQDNRPSPPYSYGSFMGIFDQSTQGVLHQLAIEFDTYKNENEQDGNHVAIDTTDIEKPVAFKSLSDFGIDLKSGREIIFKIEYDGWSKNMQIYGAYNGEPLLSILSQKIMLQYIVPSSVYVGFTASTGTVKESHRVLSWNFTSIELPKESLHKKKSVVAISATTSILGVLLIVGAVTPFVLKARRRYKAELARKQDIEALIASANGPKLFSYRKLSKATRNFSKDNLLGTGGFGSVYKGVLSDSRTTIAVKKISSTSKQGEKEYLAEICTIGRFKHKNLVQLQGWCHDHNKLLLVYEYMSNSSLDRFIGKGEFLEWTTRYNILLGLASALVYLHEECGNTVVHRDVKPNNVMLDSDFNAHLGDFGLARLLQNEPSHTTMIAGTPGYLAPEVSFTGRATIESDVYSFGMVVLEVICGKRSRGIMDDSSLVDSVWNLYERGELLDCVDKLLESKYDEEQVRRSLIVGLACLHPDYSSRPKMRKVVQIFMNAEEPLMNLSESRPSTVNLSFNLSSSSYSTTGFTSNTAFSEDHKESLPDETTVKYGL